MHVLRSPVLLASAITHDLCTTIVPAECRICEGPLLRTGSVPVCGECLGQVHAAQPAGCERCGDTFDLEDLLDLEDLRFARRASALGIQCRACRLVPPAFERAVSYGVYADELRELIHLFKFNGVASLARMLGGYLAEAILPLHGEPAGELLVVAVPLFAARERQRGYNQSVLIADAAIERIRHAESGWKLTRAHDVLVRQRRTESQWALAQRDRRRNLDGAFRVTTAGRAKIEGRTVLLVDDIMTSGATARECARVLRAAGAAKVWVATVARAHGEQALRRQQPEELTTTWDLPATAALHHQAALSARLN